MLAKSQRLTTKQLTVVMQKGRVTHSPLFLVRTLNGQPTTRLSVVAPVKVAKQAVKRTAIRRRTYAQLHTLFPRLSPTSWVIIFAKKDLEDISSEEIMDGLKVALSNAKVLNS